MKIGLYSTSQLPTLPVLDSYGGVEPFVGSLAKYFDKKGHVVKLFAPKGSFVPEKGKLFEFDATSESLEVNSELSMYKSYNKEDILDVDILHDNSHWHFPGELVPKVNYTYTLHAFKPNIQHFKPGLHYNGITLSYEHAKFEKWLTAMQFRTIQDGVVLDAYPYKAQKGDRLLWLSRLFEPKGADIAIKIAEKAKIPIDIVGSSPIDVPAYKKLITRMCEESKYADFIGKVSHKEKIEYLQNAKAVILPIRQFLNSPNDQQISLWVEAACMIPLEAMSCGTPVIATSNGMIGEVIYEGQNGFLAVAIDDFVDKIRRLDEIKPEMCRRTAEYFSFERTAEGFLRLYKQVIDGLTW
jgi:glycosyltransferase involved in cell wall biosynthesis